MLATVRFAIRAFLLFALLVLAGIYLGGVGVFELAFAIGLSLSGAWVLGFAASRKAARRSQARTA